MSSHTVQALLDRHGSTYAADAGIKLADKPSPLWQLLVLSLLMSARIGSGIAVAAASELNKAGYRTPRKMADATWQQRVDALGRGHYRRYDERTATMLGETAEKVLDEYGGDLRRIREQDVHQRLQQFKGIGPTGATIFCREVQGVWPELAPYVDDVAAKGAERLKLPTSADKLAGMVSRDDFPRLVAGCVRAARDKKVVADVLGDP
ncbi:MAG TPA: endonuclease [Nocardioidaceae bacterium]|nr:endonuclease [Nocardioidaceae bacterium]